MKSLKREWKEAQRRTLDRRIDDPPAQIPELYCCPVCLRFEFSVNLGDQRWAYCSRHRLRWSIGAAFDIDQEDDESREANELTFAAFAPVERLPRLGLVTRYPRDRPDRKSRRRQP